MLPTVNGTSRPPLNRDCNIVAKCEVPKAIFSTTLTTIKGKAAQVSDAGSAHVPEAGKLLPASVIEKQNAAAESLALVHF